MKSRLEQIARETQFGKRTRTPVNKEGYYQNTGMETYQSALSQVDLKEEIENKLEERKDLDYQKTYLIDIGCGGGRFLHQLDQEYAEQGLETYGVDRNYCDLEIPNSHFILTDVTELNHPVERRQNLTMYDDTFDILISRRCIDWIDNQVKAIEQSSRILKPDGVGFLTCLISQGEYKELKEKGIEAKALEKDDSYVYSLKV